MLENTKDKQPKILCKLSGCLCKHVGWDHGQHMQTEEVTDCPKYELHEDITVCRECGKEVCICKTCEDCIRFDKYDKKCRRGYKTGAICEHFLARKRAKRRKNEDEN